MKKQAGRPWSYRQLFEEVLKEYDNSKYAFIVSYAFVGRKTGEMPKQLYNHLRKGIKMGLLIRRIEQSVYETSEAGQRFLVRVVKDLNHGAKTRTYEAKLVAVD